MRTQKIPELSHEQKVGQIIMAIIEAAASATEAAELEDHPDAAKAVLSAVLTWMAKLSKESGIDKKDLMAMINGIVHAAYTEAN